LVAHSDAVAGIWPGFWTKHQYFGIVALDRSLLLIKPLNGPSCEASRIPDAALPEELRGRALGVELPPSSREIAQLEVQIGSCLVPVVPVVAPAAIFRSDSAQVAWFGDSVATQVMLTVHEVFHAFQGSVFRSRQNSVGAFADPSILSEQLGLLRSDGFQAQLALERAALLTAVRATTPAERWTSVRGYLALRRARLDALPPKMRAFEDNQERAEGVANWVGYEAVARAVTKRPEDVRDAIISDLSSEWHDLSGRPYSGVERYRRWHLYLVGTAKAWLLEQFGDASWKQEVTQGAALDDLFAPLSTRAGS
jgi:hypothetical protein